MGDITEISEKRLADRRSIHALEETLLALPDDQKIPAELLTSHFFAPGVYARMFVVPKGYNPGDYAQLHGNGGSGSVDWNNPLTDTVYDLFPNGAGIYGWGHAPWGHFRWGHADSMR